MCDKCNENTGIIYKNSNDKWALNIQNSHWDNLEVNYCPWCGKKLEDKTKDNLLYIKDFVSAISKEFPKIKFNYKYDSNYDTWEITYPYSNEKDLNRELLGGLIKKILLENDIYNFTICYILEK